MRKLTDCQAEYWTQSGTRITLDFNIAGTTREKRTAPSQLMKIPITLKMSMMVGITLEFACSVSDIMNEIAPDAPHSPKQSLIARVNLFESCLRSFAQAAKWRYHYRECFGRCRLRAYSSMRRS